MPRSTEANPTQAAIWNGGAGETWAEMQDVLDRLFAPVEARVVDLGFPGCGGRIIDIGCGAGSTTLAMARRLGFGGFALGVDISQPLVHAATRRASAQGLLGARFVTADAQTYALEGDAFDAAISRFGVMFFEDPVAAFRNIARAVRPGGRLAFAAWRSPAENPFMTAAARAAAPYLPDFPLIGTDEPGQFGFARADHISRVLSASGWDDVDIEPFDVEAVLDRRELALYAAKMGPVGQALRALNRDAAARVSEAVQQAFDPFVMGELARFRMACWMVTARKAGGAA